MAKHLSKAERFYIKQSLFQKKKPSQIAWELKRSKSSITREISRNSDPQCKFYLYFYKQKHFRILAKEEPIVNNH
jgi:IS30 family transposase